MDTKCCKFKNKKNGPLKTDREKNTATPDHAGKFLQRVRRAYSPRNSENSPHALRKFARGSRRFVRCC